MRKIVLVILLVLLALTPFSMAQADGLNLDDVQISVDGVPIGDLANAFSGMLTDTVEEMTEESVDMFSMFLDEMADEMTAGLNELENVMGQMGVFAHLCANCGDKQIKNIYEEGTLFLNVTAWDAVYEMQTKLRDLGYLNDKPDGCFGAKTEQAVKDFQQDAGLEPNGVACPTTRKLLAEAWAAFMNIETEPAPETAEPVVTEPVVTEPVVTEPVVTEPVVTEPVVTEPAPAAPEAAIAVSDTGVCAGNGAETVYCD